MCLLCSVGVCQRQAKWGQMFCVPLKFPTKRYLRKAKWTLTTTEFTHNRLKGFSLLSPSTFMGMSVFFFFSFFCLNSVHFCAYNSKEHNRNLSLSKMELINLQHRHIQICIKNFDHFFLKLVHHQYTTFAFFYLYLMNIQYTINKSLPVHFCFGINIISWLSISARIAQNLNFTMKNLKWKHLNFKKHLKFR